MPPRFVGFLGILVIWGTVDGLLSDGDGHGGVGEMKHLHNYGYM